MAIIIMLRFNFFNASREIEFKDYVVLLRRLSNALFVFFSYYDVMASALTVNVMTDFIGKLTTTCVYIIINLPERHKLQGESQ